MANNYILRYLPVAVDDLISIFDWIASDSPSNAAAFVDKLDQRLGNLETHPFLGRIPKDDKLKISGYRVLVIESYLVFYIIRGKTVEIHRVVHGSRNLEIAAFDQAIAAEQALSWGLITRIADDGKTVAEAENMVKEILQGSLVSFGWSKQLLTDSFHSSFEAQLQKERKGLASCAAHGDGKEGLKAFTEKRKPVFNKG